MDLSSVGGQMATQCPTCTPGNIKDLVSCLHTDTSLKYSGVTGFGSCKGQTLTVVLSPTLSWAGLYFPAPAVSPRPAACVMLQPWPLPGARMSPSPPAASWGITETKNVERIKH